ncbi:MAG TPA: DciA family protein [Xanthobacteraceae bacterium]|nr:DciA family protein [Xanthobacteraceae bacterium]
MNKPSRPVGKPLRELLGKLVGDAFARQGFASAELVTRWDDIVGHEIAAHSEPIKLQWPRPPDSEDGEAGTLVLRVEGPAAIEIQHLSGLICERVNRFLGWRAVGRLALRQAPLRRRQARAARAIDPAATARIAENLSDIKDQELKEALARLGASIRRAEGH